jgi:hypothetical protein
MLEENTWVYPSSKETLEAAGLLTIEEYIATRKNIIQMYIRSTAIYANCINTKVLPQNSAQIV